MAKTTSIPCTSLPLPQTWLPAPDLLSTTVVLEDSGFKAEKVWGEAIEDRGSQITLSALGQEAPLAEKEKWDANFAKRKKIRSMLDTLIPEFSIRIGGATSIDVTKPGIDKGYGIRKLRDFLGISVKEIIYIGDALFIGGTTIRHT